MAEGLFSALSVAGTMAPGTGVDMVGKTLQLRAAQQLPQRGHSWVRSQVTLSHLTQPAFQDQYHLQAKPGRGAGVPAHHPGLSWFSRAGPWLQSTQPGQQSP